MRPTLVLLVILGLVLGGCVVVRDGSPGNSGNAPGHLKKR